MDAPLTTSAPLLVPTAPSSFRESVEHWMRDFQLRLCAQLEETDGGATFQTDAWEHHAGGGGRTRVIQNGNILEKGGVAFSAVWGEMSAAAAKTLLMPDPRFFATGVSVVQHPRSPRQPIAHMNVRYFEAGDGQAWFGGGLDLTPIYVDERQARRFHERIFAVCERHNSTYYSRFKAWADEYFYLPHRQETRGIGGIFFDRLTVGKDGDRDELFAFVQDVGDVFGPAYTEILSENRDLPFTEAQKQWQLIRRGRYAEFNLAIDRGTRFGLETGGRTESILMSLPPQAEWYYNRQPEPGSPEAATQAWLRKDVDWLATPAPLLDRTA
ncbi:oxygen-dependent coproporphyrinogen oxidase [Hymenobacter sp. BT491]|uniref:oxygen-dependent coproporphyrinogen oxidase n=1 Tax=Hymenobacter sp. BT491 TaxID=2766779 RepID=UPI001653B611|nr:oxygen-dependent coproporphyrinogen oxidase [Hymenobacter sp. BT491]MBC6989861.1 oxygen-dependent coproporphyrinogen oxidase [Hymenobacter sp. BT491]